MTTRPARHLLVTALIVFLAACGGGGGGDGGGGGGGGGNPPPPQTFPSALDFLSPSTFANGESYVTGGSLVSISGGLNSANTPSGFCPDSETYEELQEQVDYLGMPRRMSDLGDTMLRAWQHWRAGIEGSISCLKRAFRLARCSFRGFSNFASAVGSAIFCHNLTILAKTSGG